MSRFVVAVTSGLLLCCAAPGVAQTLKSGSALKPGDTITSADERFTLAFQGDGNLVLYDDGLILWHSDTAGTGGVAASCVMQRDGNLVIYGSRNGKFGPVWSTNTSGRDGASLVCQGDGNLVVYHGGTAAWSLGTPLTFDIPSSVARDAEARKVYKAWQTAEAFVKATPLPKVLKDKKAFASLKLRLEALGTSSGDDEVRKAVATVLDTYRDIIKEYEDLEVANAMSAVPPPPTTRTEYDPITKGTRVVVEHPPALQPVVETAINTFFAHQSVKARHEAGQKALDELRDRLAKRLGVNVSSIQLKP